MLGSGAVYVLLPDVVDTDLAGRAANIILQLVRDERARNTKNKFYTHTVQFRRADMAWLLKLGDMCRIGYNCRHIVMRDTTLVISVISFLLPNQAVCSD